jgi:prepilin peptidase CpaA
MAVVGSSGGLAATIDMYTRRVPNAATMGIAGLGVLLAATHVSRVSVTGAILGFVIGLMLMLPGHFVGATGAGDVKLFAALGTLLGPSSVLIAFLYTALAGGILAVVVAIRRRSLAESVGRVATLVGTGGANVDKIEAKSVNNRFAYAPAIAVGTLVAALGW